MKQMHNVLMLPSKAAKNQIKWLGHQLGCFWCFLSPKLPKMHRHKMFDLMVLRHCGWIFEISTDLHNFSASHNLCIKTLKGAEIFAILKCLKKIYWMEQLGIKIRNLLSELMICRAKDLKVLLKWLICTIQWTAK